MGKLKENQRQDTVMMRLARFIVNKRNAFLVLFAVALVYSLCSISKVHVVDDITEYLPKSTETRQGLDIMEAEFTTFGTATVLVSNITYEKALSLAGELEEIPGISGVSFYKEGDSAYDGQERTDYYQDASALYTISFEEEESTELSQAAMAKIRQTLDGYTSYVYTTVDKDDAAQLKADMGIIMVLAVLVVLAVLLFTSKTYMEIVIFFLTFGTAILLYMGTNYWFGEISFVTNAVGAVLQLALAIDYAINLFHRFMEE